MALLDAENQQAQKYLYSGSEDPRVKGYPAYRGSIYMRTGANGGEFFQKLDDGNTKNWLRISPPETPAEASKYKVEYFTISPQQALDKKVMISQFPSNPERTLFDVLDGGGCGKYLVDFTVNGMDVSWGTGGRFDTLPATLQAGDEIRIIYY